MATGDPISGCRGDLDLPGPGGGCRWTPPGWPPPSPRARPGWWPGARGSATPSRSRWRLVVATVVVSPPSASLAAWRSAALRGPGTGCPGQHPAEERRTGVPPLHPWPPWTATGLVTAVGVGTAVVQATVAGVSGTASVEVTAPAPPGGDRWRWRRSRPPPANLIPQFGGGATRETAGIPDGRLVRVTAPARTLLGVPADRGACRWAAGWSRWSSGQFIEDLPAESTVYYRIAARSVGGGSRGEVRSFETAVARPPRAPTRLRAEFFFLNESFGRLQTCSGM